MNVVCVKRTQAPPVAGGLVSGGWGPKVGSPAFLCPIGAGAIYSGWARAPPL